MISTIGVAFNIAIYKLIKISFTYNERFIIIETISQYNLSI